jgi:hypothetical protein
MKPKRRLSAIEQLLEGNITCFVRLEGSVDVGRLRFALSQVQRKHPALGALIREEADGLYYEADCAPEIPLRIVPRVREDDYRLECQAEVTLDFAFDEPQLRAVWVQSEVESGFLFTTSHRICDAMGLLTIVREVLRSLHTGEELIPYEPVRVRDMIGGYRPAQPWKRTLAVRLVNGLLSFIPSSRTAPVTNEHYLEWGAHRAVSRSLMRCCKAEGVSVHAALLVALDRALLAVFGEKKLPKWIDSQIDARRMRLPRLKSDMLFPGGGGFRVRSGQEPEVEFWVRARAVNREMRKRIEQEILRFPGRLDFLEAVHPPTRGQLQSILKINDALRMNGRLDRFPLSNLGSVVVSESAAPFRVKDLRFYVHSSQSKVVGLMTHTFEEEMRFFCIGHKECMSRNQMDALQREFMAVLHHATPDDCAGKVAACSEETADRPVAKERSL